MAQSEGGQLPGVAGLTTTMPLRKNCMSWAQMVTQFLSGESEFDHATEKRKKLRTVDPKKELDRQGKMPYATNLKAKPQPVEENNTLANHGSNPCRKIERLWVSAGGQCENCKRAGHTHENCWFLHPYLRPSWSRAKIGDGNREKRERGRLRGGDRIEKRTEEDVSRKGEKETALSSSSESMKNRLDKIEAGIALLSSLLSPKGPNFNFSSGLGKTHALP